MRIFNESKTQVLETPDLSKGEIVGDKLFIRTEPAVEEIAEEGEYVVVREYENGGKDMKWVVTKPGIKGKPAEDIYEDIYVYIPYSESKLAEIAEEERQAQITAQIESLKIELVELAQNLQQYDIGEDVPNIEGARQRFFEAHNELRALLGKPPRQWREQLDKELNENLGELEENNEQ